MTGALLTLATAAGGVLIWYVMDRVSAARERRDRNGPAPGRTRLHRRLGLCRRDSPERAALARC